ncbi:MAG: ABC transporter permease [Acidimicrobiales bacterium]|jgi:peptide/nickel transport system permease protein
MASGGGGSLLTFVVRRLLITILLLFLITLGVYSLILILPGNPAIALAGGTKATPSEIAKITAQLHLNEGFFAQYWNWLRAALQGNLGNSLFNNETVASGIAARFPVTLSVAVGGMFVAIVIGIPAGVLSGLHQGTARDRMVTVGSSIAVAIPDFWLAMILVIVFAVKLEWLPALGYTPFTQSPAEWFQDLLLPWLALGIGGSAVIARQVRGALVDTLDQDYMRTAVAKGLSPRMVVGKHALKNALSPAVTVIGIQFGYLLGGTLIIEQIFSLPGLGTYIIQAINDKDIPEIQGVVLVVATAFVLINVVVDIIYAYLNPKVRLT